VPLTPAFATADEFARLDALTGGGKDAAPSCVAAAFSGGGDSLALLAAAAEWARARSVRLVAVHVDHGLRTASGAEAIAASAAAAALGVDCRVERWEGEKPAKGVQAAARTARHRLLARACGELEASTLLLGHTLDDQAETVLMRMHRGPATARSLAGLEPLSPSPAWPLGAALALARPLLLSRRGDLRARLAAAGLRWLEDPSNADLSYERVRTRRRLEELGPAAAPRLAALADRAREAEMARRAAAVHALEAVRLLPFGAFALDRARFAAAPEPAQLLALEAVLTAAAGAPGPVEREALSRLLAQLRSTQEFRGATLAGADVSPLPGVPDLSPVVISRDPGAAGGRAGGLPAVRDSVWDGRLRLIEELGPEAQIVPAQGLLSKLSKADRARLQEAPRSARRTAGLVIEPGKPPRLARGVFISSQAVARRVLPHAPAAWCDVAIACAALGFGLAGPHMQCCSAPAEAADHLG
jgi:tRNA(Ile)-lysidine synthase